MILLKKALSVGVLIVFVMLGFNVKSQGTSLAILPAGDSVGVGCHYKIEYVQIRSCNPGHTCNPTVFCYQFEFNVPAGGQLTFHDTVNNTTTVYGPGINTELIANNWHRNGYFIFDNAVSGYTVQVQYLGGGCNACPDCSVPGSSGIKSVDAVGVSIDSLDASWAPPASRVCWTTSPIQLDSLKNGLANGYWTGPGVDSVTGIFDPIGLTGYQKITHTLTNGFCKKEYTDSINVIPVCSFITDTVCAKNTICVNSTELLSYDTIYNCNGLNSYNGNPVLIDVNGCVSLSNFPIIKPDSACVLICDTGIALCDTVFIIWIPETTNDTIFVKVDSLTTADTCVNLESWFLNYDSISTCNGVNQTNGGITLAFNDTCFGFSSIQKLTSIDTACIVTCKDMGCSYVCDTTFVIYIPDNVPPYLQCNDTVVYLDAAGIAFIDTSFVLDSVFDNNLDSVWLSKYSFDCSNIGVNTVTVYAQDLLGNIDSCFALVTVLDTINPVVFCNDTSLFLDSAGNITLTLPHVLGGASDNCGVDFVWMNYPITSFNCNDTGTYIVKVFVRDSSGNLDSCSSTVTVVDTLLASIACKDTIVFLNANGNVTIDSSFVNNGSFDNCGFTLSVFPDSFTCSDIGSNTVTLTMVDFLGNITTCVSTVTVIDTISPLVICQDVTIRLDSNGIAVVSLLNINGGDSDNCSVDSIWIDKDTFSCSDIGQNMVLLTATDSSGNIATCQAVVTVIDTIYPSIICPNDMQDTVLDICEYTLPDYTGLPVAADNCLGSTSISITQIPIPGTIITIPEVIGSQAFNQIITLVISDGVNADSCDFNLMLTCINELEIPQFISPNGDDKNDRWIIPNIDFYPNSIVKIFNRWGNLCYQKSGGYDNSFEGKANVKINVGNNNNYLPSGTYFYIVRKNESEEGQSGFLQIKK